MSKLYLIIMSLLYKPMAQFFAIQLLSVVGMALIFMFVLQMKRGLCPLNHVPFFQYRTLSMGHLYDDDQSLSIESIYTSQLCSNKRPLQSIGKAKEL